jgi:FkbM family methyltransferase
MLRSFIRHKFKLASQSPTLRPLVAKILSVLGPFTRNGVKLVRYNEGWIHYFENIISCEHEPRLRGYHLLHELNDYIWGTLFKPKEGDIVIDVGAGIGSETLYYANSVGPTGRVIAIEALPEIYKYLENSVRLNEYRHVVPINCAITEKTGSVTIENDIENFLGNSIDDQNGSGIKVKAKTLDEIVESQKIEVVDFIKMNIEGAERSALIGMEQALKKTRVICISCHDFKYKKTNNLFFKTFDDVETAVKKAGWKIVYRSSDREELKYQINAYNPKLFDPLA